MFTIRKGGQLFYCLAAIMSRELNETQIFCYFLEILEEKVKNDILKHRIELKLKFSGSFE